MCFYEFFLVCEISTFVNKYFLLCEIWAFWFQHVKTKYDIQAVEFLLENVVFLERKCQLCETYSQFGWDGSDIWYLFV